MSLKGVLYGIWLGSLCIISTGRAQAPKPELEPEPLVFEDDEIAADLDTIVITGSRTEHRLRDSPVATELITQRDIETSGAETAADLLEEHPGVDMSRSFRGAGIRLQGLDAKHILILIDGERVAGRIDGVIDLTRIPVEDIEKIEIVKGPSSALYGSDAVGGVINVITRRSEKEQEAELHGVYGSFNTIDLSGRVGLQDSPWNTRFSGGWHHIDAFDLNPEDLATTGSEETRWSIANRSEYELQSGSSIQLRSSYMRRDRDGIDSNDAGAVFDRRNRTENLSVSLGSQLQPSSASKLRLNINYSLFRDQFLYDQRRSSALDQEQETYDQLTQLSVQYDHSLLERHLLSVGVEGLYEHLRSQRLEDGEGNRARIAMFLQDEWTILEDTPLITTPGLRFDVDSQFGTQPTPKVGLRYDPHETTTLRASYGMGFRSPVFKELLLLFENPSVGYVVEGNPELKPETSHSFNLGLECIPESWGWFSFNLFHNQIDNLIFTERSGTVGTGLTQRFAYTNIASAYTRGLEGRIRLRMMKGLTVEGGYALTDSRDLQNSRRLEGRALHRGTADLRWTPSALKLELTLRASIVGGRPFYEDLDRDGTDETVYADPYATLDARVGFQLGDQLTLFVGAENLLNEGDADYLPIQPRTFYAGATGRL